MPARTAFPPPAPATQPDGDVRPASATAPSHDPQPFPPGDGSYDLSPTEVALEAYARYVDRGRVDGHDVEDWLAAEETVRRRARNPGR